jgi:hypothetical protein
LKPTRSPKFKNEHLLGTGTKIEINITKVEEVVSFTNLALGCNFVAQEFAPPSFSTDIE